MACVWGGTPRTSTQVVGFGGEARPGPPHMSVLWGDTSQTSPHLLVCGEARFRPPHMSV